jgi:hypothetical protein
MLHRLKTWMIAFVSFALFSQRASAILFMAPQASIEDFQKYVLLKNQQSYTQWYLEKSRHDESEAHPQVLEFSQKVLNENLPLSKQILEEWDYLRSVMDLNKADREILFVLADKVHLQRELCRYALLEPNLIQKVEIPNLLESCQKKAATLPSSVLAQLDERDLLVIDGAVLKREQVPAKLVEGLYQWRIISDRFEDRGVIGTPVEFGEERFRNQHWVNGRCDDYKLNHKDFSVLAQSQIYFDDSCVVTALQPPKTFKTWAEDHKTLLWGLGILASGLVVYQLKDKELIITK